MAAHEACCACGALRVRAEAEPTTVAACSCEDCHRRTGSVIGVVAIYPEAVLAITGESRRFARPTAKGSTITFHFCPTCGSSLFWRPASRPGMVGVAVGGFGDPAMRAPKDAIWKDLRPSWLCLASEVQTL